MRCISTSKLHLCLGTKQKSCQILNKIIPVNDERIGTALESTTYGKTMSLDFSLVAEVTIQKGTQVQGHLLLGEHSAQFHC